MDFQSSAMAMVVIADMVKNERRVIFLWLITILLVIVVALSYALAFSLWWVSINPLTIAPRQHFWRFLAALLRFLAALEMTDLALVSFRLRGEISEGRNLRVFRF